MQIGSQNSSSTRELSICEIFLPPASTLGPLWSPKLSIEQGNLQNRGLRGDSSSALAFKPIRVSQQTEEKKRKTFESHNCFWCSVLVKVSLGLIQALMVPSAPSPPHRETA